MPIFLTSAASAGGRGLGEGFYVAALPRQVLRLQLQPQMPAQAFGFDFCGDSIILQD